jgi:hypothetical protein
MAGWWRFLYRTFGWNYHETPSQETLRARNDCLKKIRDKDFILNSAEAEKTTKKKKKKEKEKKKNNR